VRRAASPATIATAWALGQPGIAAVCVGARRPGQIDEIIGADAIDLTADDAAYLEAAASGGLEPSEQPAGPGNAARR
jgi:aryl-alcohol dehydrogenase-like predicted oxidoreductase